MKVVTILGTRPEIIRLSCIIPKLDALCEHLVVHTGQNYEDGLSQIFFRELDLRAPDYSLGIHAATFGEQIARILCESEAILRRELPERLVILGDTNSGLASIVARRLGIAVYHLEAGNRCFDDRVPEEINRRIIDHTSSVLLPYTHRSKENLLREGIPRERIHVVGNPIYEVLLRHQDRIVDSKVLDRLQIRPGEFMLLTMHRAETVDFPDRISSLMDGLQRLHAKIGLPIVCSLHPRTRDRLTSIDLGTLGGGIRFLEPLGFFDFVALERAARCVISDSGTVQEECCIARVPNIIIREATERPETIECGSSILAGVTAETLLEAARVALEQPHEWNPPCEYLERDVSSKVAKIVLGW